MDWKRIQEEILYWDGSWRDIYFQGTNKQVWEKFLDFIGKSNLKYELTLGDAVSKILPYSEIKEYESKILKIWVDDILLVCHFFCDDEIEMDIDPREVKNIETWNNLINVLKNLSRYIGIKGKITPENMESIVLLDIY
jgi:hypothetical protein